MHTLADAAGYDTDKLAHASYLAAYERHFAPLRERPIRLLEIGVKAGGSLRLWCDYFPLATVVGLDVAPVAVDDDTGRIRVFQGMQQDAALLDRIARETAPEGFDIVIDDGAHVGALAEASFDALFDRHLRPGGLYVIEDWGTGYWPSWPDGAVFTPGAPPRPPLAARLATALARTPLGRPAVASKVLRQIARRASPDTNAGHGAGMVGFVKRLVDEAGIADATDAGRGTGAPRRPRIARMEVTHGQVFIVKAG